MQVKTNPRLSPQMAQPTSVRGMMLDVIIALLPTLAMSVFLFGWWVLVLCAISVGSCVGFEMAYRRLTHQNSTVGDLSACVTGLLLALSLPSDSAWWIPVLGAAFAIVVVKQFYGGLGRNFMNPALAGRMLLASFPILMTSWVDPVLRLSQQDLDTITSATPMSFLHEGRLPSEGLRELLLGQHAGSLGEVSVFMLLLGGVYLVGRKVISPRIPLSFIGTVAALAFLFPQGNNDRIEWMLAQMFSGGIVLAAVFMATDPTTSPVTPHGQIIYGVGCGTLTIVLRYFSSYPEGVGWAILTMNTCVWLCDKSGMPRRYGGAHFSVLRHWLAEFKARVSEIRFVKPDLGLMKGDGKAPGESYLDVLRSMLPNVAWIGATVVAMGVLVHVGHYATDLAMAQAENRRDQELLEQVMPGAAFSSEAPIRVTGALSIQHAFDGENEVMGHCVEVQSQGFGGVITMTVGVNLDGKVTGVAITDHRETTSVVEEALSDAYLNRYIGRSGTLRTSGANRIDTVSGATATSKAITAGVNRALAIVAGLGEIHEAQMDEVEYEV